MYLFPHICIFYFFNFFIAPCFRDFGKALILSCITSNG